MNQVEEEETPLTEKYKVKLKKQKKTFQKDQKMDFFGGISVTVKALLLVGN